jgi:hypothetical protein
MEAQVLSIPIFIAELIPTEIKKKRNNRNSSRKTNGVNLQNFIALLKAYTGLGMRTKLISSTLLTALNGGMP